MRQKMSKVFILGSIALDSLETPFGKRKDVLGGSVSYASVASSLFSKTNIVGVVGEDFPQQHIELLESKGINTDGLEKTAGKTFRWDGFYEYDMNQAHTLDTQLNVFADFCPKIPESYKDSKFIFLANIHPSLQLNVLEQFDNPEFVMLDTMNLWINTTKEDLQKVISKVDLMLLNDAEARQLCDTPNLVEAANKVLEMGPSYVIIKKGEHGALLFTKSGEVFAAPAYPLEAIKDPTGAGDTFAGGFIGYLASCGEINFKQMKKAIIVGSALASYTAEDFSLDKLKTVDYDDLCQRYSEFENLTEFGTLNLVAAAV
jgi:ribokinase